MCARAVAMSRNMSVRVLNDQIEADMKLDKQHIRNWMKSFQMVEAASRYLLLELAEVCAC